MNERLVSGPVGSVSSSHAVAAAVAAPEVRPVPNAERRSEDMNEVGTPLLLVSTLGSLDVFATAVHAGSWWTSTIAPHPGLRNSKVGFSF